jgi:hypothetical protein
MMDDLKAQVWAVDALGALAHETRLSVFRSLVKAGPDGMIAGAINRPLVVSPLGVRLCRPSEEVLDLIPADQRGAFAKEDGEQVVDAWGQRVK